MGTILSPVTFGFITCAPNDDLFEHPSTEQTLGQGFFEKLIQCCFHVPHLHDLLLVPPLLDHPFVGMLMVFILATLTI